MAKRFTDNEIWKKQRWFKKLSPEYKLVFFYIKDQCDHWGMWKIDCVDLMEDTGIENFDLHDFVEKINRDFDKITGKSVKKERVKILNKTSIWITSFLQFQWENKSGLLSPLTPAVRTALSGWIALGVFDEALHKGYVTVTNPYKTLKELKEFLDKGCETLRVRERVRDRDLFNSNSGKNENGKNEKKQQPSNFAAQGPDRVFERHAEHLAASTGKNRKKNH